MCNSLLCGNTDTDSLALAFVQIFVFVLQYLTHSGNIWVEVVVVVLEVVKVVLA